LMLMLNRVELISLFKFCYCLTGFEKSAYALLYFFLKQQETSGKKHVSNHISGWQAALFKQFIENYQDSNFELPQKVLEHKSSSDIVCTDLLKLSMDSRTFLRFFASAPFHVKALLYLITRDGINLESIERVLNVTTEQMKALTSFTKKSINDVQKNNLTRTSIKYELDACLKDVSLPIEKEKKLLKLLLSLKTENSDNKKPTTIEEKRVEESVLEINNAIKLSKIQKAAKLRNSSTKNPAVNALNNKVQQASESNIAQEINLPNTNRRRSNKTTSFDTPSVFVENASSSLEFAHKAKPKKKQKMIKNVLDNLEMTMGDVFSGRTFFRTHRVEFMSHEEKEEVERQHSTWSGVLGFIVVVFSIGLLAVSQIQ
ncbi:MAG: hypothetical protein AAGB12_11775, partial [Pseudomonadota bacterium]